MLQVGFEREDFTGKPVIALINTWSELEPLQRAPSRTRGDGEARRVAGGWLPGEIPALSIPEPYMKPSPMLYRNLLAMDAEEILRSMPIDGTVMLGGCDKTTPGLLMGAISANLPAIYVPGGPMLRGNWDGKPLGSGTDVWKSWADRCAGVVTDADLTAIEAGIARSPGFCMTMGTASTMTAMSEVLGMTLPGASSIPAPDSNHSRMAMETGRRVVEMVWEDLTPERVLSAESFHNAIVVDMALGGSTNAIIHLVALAKRRGFDLPLPIFDEISRTVPVLANIRPSGEYLMEDFYYAGGLRALMAQIADLLHTDCMTVNGKTIGENLEGARVTNPKVIRERKDPLLTSGGTVILFGSLAPDGAVIKESAVSPHLKQHTGKAFVFENFADYEVRANRDDLDLDEDSVLVLKNAGPQGGPGMPEWGNFQLPKIILERGVRDMVRISDCRMSGTAYGACVLHVAPESYVGGPLALVQDGDLIRLDIPNRTLDLLVPEAEMAKRRAAWKPPVETERRGYVALYRKHVTQANLGCDFDFLETDPEHKSELPAPPLA